jgi:protein-S-isoprenylcysteine O-methyltransferase Ste14
MQSEALLRDVLIGCLLVVFPIAAYFRLRSQATREPLDRRQEGPFILATLRPAGLAHIVGLIVYLVNPARMAWASLPLPMSLRWAGIALLAVTAALLLWTLRSLGKNLTDTVVTRRAHTLVTHGPYRWIRHPFYDCVLLLMIATSLAAANWFLLLTGLITFTMMVVRTRIEERNLVARFGDGYRAYMAATARFFPRQRASQAPGVDSAHPVR